MSDQLTLAEVTEVLRSAAFRAGIAHLFDDLPLMAPHVRCVHVAKIFAQIDDPAVQQALEQTHAIEILKKETMLRLKAAEKPMKAAP